MSYTIFEPLGANLEPIQNHQVKRKGNILSVTPDPKINHLLSGHDFEAKPFTTDTTSVLSHAHIPVITADSLVMAQPILFDDLSAASEWHQNWDSDHRTPVYLKDGVTYSDMDSIAAAALHFLNLYDRTVSRWTDAKTHALIADLNCISTDNKKRLAQYLYTIGYDTANTLGMFKHHSGDDDQHGTLLIAPIEKNIACSIIQHMQCPNIYRLTPDSTNPEGWFIEI